ncbi:uncharacterized protein LOC134219805 [Armigeres subalbatus]|uniref:uncharacterized protein LOC134219805 n=1 Tax=Armigeres subalbatus TaxID=124917 RepID=UPI002ED125E3
MEVRLFEDLEEGEIEPKEHRPGDIEIWNEQISSTQECAENLEDRFDGGSGDGECETIEPAIVVVDLTDNEDEPQDETPGTGVEQFNSLLSWLQEYFELTLQNKLAKLVDFALCEQCKQPINDIFDMVFVEQFHLVCFYKFNLGQELPQETIANIELLKIQLFQAFKSVNASQDLIRTHPQFRQFLESLKSEISNRVCLECGQTSENVQDHLHKTQQRTIAKASTSTKVRYQCRFCTEYFEYEFLQLRHEMQHPNLVKEKYSGMVLRNEQLLCPYCRVRFDKNHRMQQHLLAHEKAVKFDPTKRLKTYPAVTLRTRRKVTIKTETDESKRPYSLRCYSNVKFRRK